MPAEESRRRVNRTLGQKLVRGEHRQPEEHEAGAGAFGKIVGSRGTRESRIGDGATEHDSTGRLPHQDGEEQ